MFINFDVNNGLSINTYRIPQATVGSIDDLALAVTNCDECVTCDLTEDVKDTLESGEHWNGSPVTTEALSKIHNVITDAESVYTS